MENLLSENKDTNPPSKLPSNSLSTSEPSEPDLSDPLQSTVDSNNNNDAGGEPSNKYTCMVCPQSFNVKGNIERHMKPVHRSEGEPFGCSICTKKFSRRDYLHRHLVTFHTTGSKCNPCGLAYRDSDTLSLHMKSKHDMNVVEAEVIEKSPTVLTAAKKQVSSQENLIKFQNS